MPHGVEHQPHCPPFLPPLCPPPCPQVGAVVVGFDREVNYYKIQYATLCIRENPGCMFIATNRDAVTHLTDAQEWAGARGEAVRTGVVCAGAQGEGGGVFSPPPPPLQSTSHITQAMAG